MHLARIAVCCASLTFVAHLCSGQTALSTNEPAFKSRPQFEVATIRPVKQDGHSGFGWEVTPSGRFTAANQPLGNMVSLAYGGSGSGSIVDTSKCPEYGSFDVNATHPGVRIGAGEGWCEAERSRITGTGRPRRRTETGQGRSDGGSATWRSMAHGEHLERKCCAGR